MGTVDLILLGLAAGGGAGLLAGLIGISAYSCKAARSRELRRKRSADLPGRAIGPGSPTIP